MKKKFIILCLVIAFLFTLLFSYVFSIFSFNSFITIRTLLYMVSIFSILSYINIAIYYLVSKKIKKEKISLLKITSMVLFLIAILIVIFLIIGLEIDYLNWYSNSSPFYIHMILKSIEYLVPAIFMVVVGIFLIKNDNGKKLL